jgi:23S rRNA pseudouridine1911/1915/1917 synthase
MILKHPPKKPAKSTSKTRKSAGGVALEQAKEPSSQKHEIVLDGKVGRLDKILSQSLSAQGTEVSRARLQKLIVQGAVCVNGKVADDISYKLRGAQTITLEIPQATDAQPRAQKIKLDVVYEDKDLLVINKPAGMVVHPAAGNLDGTLVNALLAHCGKSLSGIGGVKRPGIVHRLDKDTSGLMVVAKHDKAHQGLSQQFSGENGKTLSRVYNAFIWGAPDTKRGTITGDIGRSETNRKKMALVSYGKHATTHFEVLQSYAPTPDAEGFGAVIKKNKSARKENKAPFAALIQCVLETGRTHQIRVHLAHIGNSIIGDELYGNAKGCKQRAQSQLKKLAGDDHTAISSPYSPLNFKRQALHAKQLSFIHPVSGKEMTFEAPLPKDMQKLSEILGKFI